MTQQTFNTLAQSKLPWDLIETLRSDDEAILEFLLGERQVEKARKYGLTLQLVIGAEDFNSGLCECSVIVKGPEYWRTFWLLEYQPKWP